MLIKDKTELLHNIDKFNLLLKNPEIVELLGKFRRWYACKNQDNEWFLAPSKFIGYSNVDLEKYLDPNNGFDGRETEKVLQTMSREPVSAELKESRAALSRLCEKYGKKENKVASIRIIDPINISSDEVIVRSISDLINALPDESRMEIAKSIYLP